MLWIVKSDGERAAERAQCSRLHVAGEVRHDRHGLGEGKALCFDQVVDEAGQLKVFVLGGAPN